MKVTSIVGVCSLLIATSLPSIGNSSKVKRNTWSEIGRLENGNIQKEQDNQNNITTETVPFKADRSDYEKAEDISKMKSDDSVLSEESISVNKEEVSDFSKIAHIEQNKQSHAQKNMKMEKIAEVSDWVEFRQALENPEVEIVKVLSDIKQEERKVIEVVNHDVVIYGGNHTLKIGTPTISVAETSKVTIHDVEIKANKDSGVLFSGEGSVELQGKITSPLNGKSQNLVLSQVANTKVKNATIEFEGDVAKENSIFSETSLIIENSILKTKGSFFWSDKREGASLLISQGSKVYLESFEDEVLLELTALGSKVTVSDNNTLLDARSDSKFSGDVMKYAPKNGSAVFSIENGAKVNLLSNKGTALEMSENSENPTLNLDNEAELIMKNKSSGGEGVFSIGTSISSGGTSKTTININNHSKIKVDSAMDTPRKAGMRFVGLVTTFNISNGSDLVVRNKGESSAIKFGQGNVFEKLNNTFLIDGKDSSVDIASTEGQALTGNNIDINANPETFFVARGNSSNGAFSGNNLSIMLNQPSYFDFKNEASDGVAIKAGTGSSFESVNTNIAFWKKKTDFDKDPDVRAENISLKAHGSPLSSYESNSQEFKQELEKNGKAFDAFHRITGNNQIGAVANLRVPTDADGAVYAQAYFPQGKWDEGRPANEGEVMATASVVEPGTGATYEVSGTSKSADFKIYGEEPRPGTVEMKVPDEKKLLKPKSRVKMKEAIVTIGGEGKVRIPGKEKIVGDTVTVQDVTPPFQTKVSGDGQHVSVEATSIKGQTNEPASVKIVSEDGKYQTDYIETKDNEFEIPMPEGIKKDEVLYLVTRDKSGSPIDVPNLPLTNDSFGNNTPIVKEGEPDFSYHDNPSFTKAIKLVVDEVKPEPEGELSLCVPNRIDFGVEEISNEDKVIRVKEVVEPLVVKDTHTVKVPWTLQVKEISPLTSDTKVLHQALKYKVNNEEPEQILSRESILIDKSKVEEGQIEKNYSETWLDKESNLGLYLKLTPKQQRLGNYKGVVEFTLVQSVGEEIE